VIGIAGDVVSGYVGDGVDSTCIYFSTSAQAPDSGSLLVRIGGNTSAASRLLEAAANRVAPGAIDQTVTLDELLALQMYLFHRVVLDFPAAWAGSRCFLQPPASTV